MNLPTVAVAQRATGMSEDGRDPQKLDFLVSVNFFRLLGEVTFLSLSLLRARVRASSICESLCGHKY